MNLNMIRPKNGTEVLLLSIAKNCETISEQTHKKTEDTLEFKLTKSRETFHFSQHISIKRSWMINLTILEVFNSNFVITEGNNKFELYTFPASKLRGVTYEKVKKEIEKVLVISDFTATDLQDQIKGPNFY